MLTIRTRYGRRGVLLGWAVLLLLPAVPRVSRAGDPSGPSGLRRAFPLSAPAELARTGVERLGRLEAVEMVRALLQGEELGPGMGWYHPGVVRHDWRWFAERCGADPGGAVRREQFPGPVEDFRRLDRDRDGVLRAADFSWAEDAQIHLERQRFKAVDVDGNGQISSAEWSSFFEAAAKGGSDLTFEDFAAAFKPAPARQAEQGAGGPKGRSRTARWLKGVLSGDIGSYFEGPGLGQVAPDFTLGARDGRGRITLSEFRGDKPLVLVFGSFSCGGFRSHYRAVEDLYRRHGDEVRFLAVYVREAHPTDGLRSATNDRAGIVIKQPTLKADREAAARACSARLDVTIPMVLDEMDDRIGHAYSGMPNRLYLIDAEGKVAYKSGRGPFGFKAGELEQQILMLRMERGAGASRPEAGPPRGGDRTVGRAGR